MELANLGDIIEWDFTNEKQITVFGKTHQAEVLMIDDQEKHYGVIAKYGQDYIEFDKSRIINQK